MRPTMIATLALALLLTSGCGTMTHMVSDCPGDPLGGVVKDVEWIGGLNILAILDLPLSLVADVVLLPWTLTFGSLG